MNTIIYALLIFVLVGFVVSIISFLNFLASFSSLTQTTIATGYDRPRENLLTGGFGPLLRVFLYKENTPAGWVLFRNAAVFAVSFGATLAAAFLLFDLNEKHCVLSMTQTAPDGSVIVLCPAYDSEAGVEQTNA